MKNQVIKQLRKFSDYTLAKFITLIQVENEQDQKAIDNYFKATSYEHPKYGRICNIEPVSYDMCEPNKRMYIVYSLHGYGYSVYDDIDSELNELAKL